MTVLDNIHSARDSNATSAPLNFSIGNFAHGGMFWLVVAIVGAFIFFADGINALLEAWQLPEYSHGPLIPVLSGLLFLRQLKDIPIQTGKIPRRWPGVVLVVAAIGLGLLGNLSNINDLVAYALILWVGGILLVSWGWDQGKHFWPGVVHLVYMLPLPGVIYYKVSTYLQFISSELGVFFLNVAQVPVYLEGNIIDLGVIQLHVAEACSGLRYMFPIMSFSYIFAVLFRGPIWHKIVLLLAAVPIAIVMNSIRIAVAGMIVQHYGVEWLEGFTHFFEGWIIFLACIIILFIAAWAMLKISGMRMSLAEALDLDTDGVLPQVARLQYVRASGAMITVACIACAAALAWQAVPPRGETPVSRESFVAFPRSFNDWEQLGSRQILSERTEFVLAADDYHQVNFVSPNASEYVSLFMAWYDDQSDGGVHSPEVCLPGAGWEIAWLDRADISAEMGRTADQTPFMMNKAIIQKGEQRMMVFYWFQQKERRIAWDFAARFWLMMDGIRTGRTDGAIVRLTTPIGKNEDDAVAEARLMDVLKGVNPHLPRFIPEQTDTTL